jgi:translation initiation factor 1 (eIF-1/SUI1)
MGWGRTAHQHSDLDMTMCFDTMKRATAGVVIQTEAIIDRRGITATTELELPIDDMAQIGPELERELRGQQVEIMARMAEERRQRKRG